LNNVNGKFDLSIRIKNLAEFRARIVVQTEAVMKVYFVKHFNSHYEDKTWHYLSQKTCLLTDQACSYIPIVNQRSSTLLQYWSFRKRE